MEFSSPHICISKLSWGKMWVNVTKKSNRAEEMNTHTQNETQTHVSSNFPAVLPDCDSFKDLAPFLLVTSYIISCFYCGVSDAQWQLFKLPSGNQLT